MQHSKWSEYVNIFIDTNVFLSFYHFTSDDLEELKKLAVLARERKVFIFLPKQVVHEFYRNRANKIAEAIKKLRVQKTALQVPQISKQYEEYDALLDANNEVEKNISKILNNMQRDAINISLEADSLIDELFTVSIQIDRSEELINRARLRVELGDPPGKRGSIGDAVNWESLLHEVPDGEDLIFICGDGDFFSPLDREAIDPYLVDEWTHKKGSSIQPYDRISRMFRAHFPDIELASELEKELCIQQLVTSRSFTRTHRSIAKLAQFYEFTPSELKEIVEATIVNKQIYWISRDPDVNQFLVAILDGREDEIDPENLQKIDYIINEIEPYGELPSKLK